MRKTLEVVDDFYGNPMSHRERALRRVESAQRAEKSDIYHGSDASEPLDDDEATGRILRILGRGAGDTFRAAVCGYYTFRAEDARDPPMHLEGFDWVGLVCLSLPEQCSGSIWLYRREQAPPRAPDTDITSDDPGSTSDARPHAFRRPQSPRQAEAHQETICLPTRFNRMVLFQTSALGYGVSFGPKKTLESGLLVQALGFSE
jgi:hypothetical protein